MGEPDCLGMVDHYVLADRKWKLTAWCWKLYVPRGAVETARGWASDPHTAKRQVEDAVVRNWQ